MNDREINETAVARSRPIHRYLGRFAWATSLAMALGACSTSGSAEAGDSTEPSQAVEEAEKPGDRVTLSEVGLRNAGIVVEPVRVEAAAGGGGELEVPGQVELDPARVALVSPRTGGRIEQLLVVPGDRVRGGQTVAFIYSSAFVTAQHDLQQAKRRAELLAGTADSQGAEALLAAARRRVEVLGLPEDVIAKLEQGSEPLALLPVVAPFAGSILEAGALTGAAAEVGTPLFTIADLTVVNVAANVPERALRGVRVGQRAAIRVAAFPDRRFAGRVTRVRDQLDTVTRTVEALVQVSNTDRVLRPGMFATVGLTVPDVLATGGPASERVLTVPTSAIIADGAVQYLFVEVETRTFERRAVELASGLGATTIAGRVVVLSGLAAGERVVTRGAFTLKSELAKASLTEQED